MITLKANELRLGDVVECFEGPWGTATVNKLTETDVGLHRPYGTNADFTCGNESLICYTGLEVFTVPRNGNTFKVWRRADHLK